MNDRATNGNVKVLLADDHTLFRQGLAELLASYGGMEVVGETNNDRGAIELARKKKPDVVIMQVQMPPEKVKRALDPMRVLSPAPKVVVTVFEDPRMMRELLKLGASAYVLKGAYSHQLIGAVRAAAYDPRARTWWWACPDRRHYRPSPPRETANSVRFHARRCRPRVA